MRRTTLFSVFLCLFALCLLPAAALADPEPLDRDGDNLFDSRLSPNSESFEAWDEDDDGYIERAVFTERFGQGAVYSRWDGDGDGVINRDEFARNAYARWDFDQDGYIEDYEWSAAIDNWFTGDAGDFVAWDQNDDGFLDNTELRNGLIQAGLFDEWDQNADGLLDAREFGARAGEAWDIDNDNLINEDEYLGTI